MCKHILNAKGFCNVCLFKLTLSNGKLFAVHDTLSKIRNNETETTRCEHCGQRLQKNAWGESWFHQETAIKCGYVGGVPNTTDEKQIIQFVENWLK